MPLKIGKWIRGWKLGSWFKKQFRNLDNEAKILLPVVIKMVEGIKVVIDSRIADAATEIIKGDWDDGLKEKARIALPKLILKLKLVEAAVNIEDPVEQINAIFAQLKFSSDVDRDMFLHNISSLLLELLSDGKFSMSDAIILSESYYQYIHKAA